MDFGFYWLDGVCHTQDSDQEQYQELIRWARQARGHNPAAFDRVVTWLKDDAAWTAAKMADNKRILLDEIIGRFKVQTRQLRSCLKELAAAGVVNDAVWQALDNLETELSGQPHDQKRLGAAVSLMFTDFSALLDPALRNLLAGDRTGPTGTDSIATFGYINSLKNSDAAVQWALFMPQMVQEQQKGFSLTSFEYRTMPAMRFIGQAGELDPAARTELFSKLDELAASKSDFFYDILLMHHYGKGVDLEPWHGFWGRFFQAETPVPDGLVFFDFQPEFDDTPGPPFGSQFAFAIFTGDLAAMHEVAGYDSDAMYDVTRNVMLGQNVIIPYPEKYWTAEVFLEGQQNPSNAYLFSADYTEDKI